MLVKIGSAFLDPTEIAAFMPADVYDLYDSDNSTHVCIVLRRGGSFWIEATMDEAEAALIDAGVIEEPTYDSQPTLKDDEIPILEKLDADGYAWLARDKDNKLYAYREKPYYDGAYWNANASSIPTSFHVANGFDFISVDDEEPWGIVQLLNWNAI